MAVLKGFNKIKRWDFEVYDSRDNELAGVIHYERGLTTEKATLDAKNFQKFAGWITWAWDKVPDRSNLLIDFFENRVNPPDRCFLAEHMESIGVDPYDWITRMKLNGGRTHTDSLYVKVIDLDDRQDEYIQSE